MLFVKHFAFTLLLSWESSLSLAQTANNNAAQAMAQARDVIASMVQANPRLTPEFLRMGFHDCVGGCDGCIDLSNPNNNGLAHPISVLDPVVQQFATAATGLSRADIWALAATVGADVADHGNITNPISFTQNWFGRVNCEDADSVCFNAQGQSVPCSQTAGPNQVMPSATFDSASVFSYFANNFGFTERQTVTIMGAHTCGHLVKSESGIDGPHGWTLNNVKLQHEYYVALVTTATSATPDSLKADLSPNWFQKFEDNSGSSFASLNRWELDVQGLKLVMLNSDVSLVRDLNETNTDPVSGAVSCTFNSHVGSPSCSIRSTINVALEFSDNNDLWLSEFKTTLDLMLTNGYTRAPCSSAMCQLTNNRMRPTPPRVQPTALPTKPPTKLPIKMPTRKPTVRPTVVSSKPPALRPPTRKPTRQPTRKPSSPHSISNTFIPTQQPHTSPARVVVPSTSPVAFPTPQPTSLPTSLPTSQPSPPPTAQPTPLPLPPHTPWPTPFTTPSPSAHANDVCVSFLGDCSRIGCCPGLNCFGFFWKQCWL